MFVYIPSIPIIILAVCIIDTVVKKLHDNMMRSSVDKNSSVTARGDISGARMMTYPRRIWWVFLFSSAARMAAVGIFCASIFSSLSRLEIMRRLPRDGIRGTFPKG